MEKDILRITREDGDVSVHIPDMNLAVMTLADVIWDGIKRRDLKGLNVLCSVVVHTLARDMSGKLQEEFLDNIRKIVPTYRNVYKKMREQKKNAS